MKRAVIELDYAEVKAIIEHFNDGRIMGTPLENKLNSIITQNIQQNKIEISEEELEIILDEFAIPEPTDSTAIITLRTKLQKQLFEFHKSDQVTI